MEVELPKSSHVFTLIPDQGKITINAAEEKFREDPTFVFLIEEEVAGPLESVSQYLEVPTEEILKTAITATDYLQNPDYIYEVNQYDRLKAFLRETSKRKGKTLSDLARLIPSLPVTPKTPTTIKTVTPSSKEKGKELYTEAELKILTVPVLKEILKQNKLPFSGLKAVLINRILENKTIKPSAVAPTTPAKETAAIETPTPKSEVTPTLVSSKEAATVIPRPTPPVEETETSATPITKEPTTTQAKPKTPVKAAKTPIKATPVKAAAKPVTPKPVTPTKEKPTPKPEVPAEPETAKPEVPAEPETPKPSLYTADELSKMKVTELKNILREHNMKVSGLKAELVDRILKGNVYKDVVKEVPLETLVAPETTLLEPKVRTPLPPLPEIQSEAPTEPETEHYSQQSLNQLKVTDLKDILRAKKLKLAGNKAELIQRILESETISAETPKPAEKPKEIPQPTEEEGEEEPIETQGEFDPNHDRFMFFSGSKDVAPGKGVDEFVNDPSMYQELAQIKDWRKKLSNFWMQPFEVDDLTWNSVEHYYQGSKFREGHPEFFQEFSVESGSDISKDPALAKAAGGKTGVSKGKQIRPKNITVDPGFFTPENQKEIFQTAMLNKFSQNEDLLQALLATGDAYLQHKTRGIPLHRVMVLEEVRSILGESEGEEVAEEEVEEEIELSEEFLNQQPLTEIKAIAQSFGISLEGMKKLDIIKSILEANAQKEVIKPGKEEE